MLNDDISPIAAKSPMKTRMSLNPNLMLPQMPQNLK